MLYGIDISNWQKGLTLTNEIDFAIMKATGGTGFVDHCCDDWVQECKIKNILWGFYHFAGDGWTPKPEEEAAWFYENTKDYVGEGIPVLDIEDNRIEDWGAYSQRFVDKYHAITGVWPIIYTSAGYLNAFNGYPLVETCGLWVAGYPNNKRYSIGEVPEFPYSISPWPFAAIWQYTSNGWIDSYNDSLDFDIAYMDEHAWKLYANPKQGKVDDTMLLPSPTDSPSKHKHYHFSNSVLDVDITLKGGK